jgi:arylsulfatase A-like enzyme
MSEQPSAAIPSPEFGVRNGRGDDPGRVGCDVRGAVRPSRLQQGRSSGSWIAGLICLISGLAAAGAYGAVRGVERVIVIGCDGMGRVAFTGTRTPVLDGLRARGASTLHARAVMPTSSSPNWASMIMGAGPEQHGVTSNDWQTNKFDIAPTAVGPGGIFPTLFGLLRAQRPRWEIGVVHDWGDYGRLFERTAPNLIEHVKGSPATARRAVEYLRQKQPHFLFVHFDDVDHAGHDHGWGSSQYVAAVQTIDGLIGEILAALRESGLESRTLVLVTADHGGNGKSHGGNSMDELEIPWILAGPGVRRGYTLRAQVNTFDTGPTLGYALGIKTPDCWIGRPVLEAFGAGR